MDWKNYYTSRQITASEAATMIKNGNRITYGHATGEPQLIAPEIVKRETELEDVLFVHGLTMGPAVYCHEDIDPQKIGHLSLFASTHTRKAVQDGRANLVPMHFSDIPIAFRQGILPVDVAIIHISEPDAFGYCSYGISVDFQDSVIKTAQLVIAEVNSKMPRTYGDTLVHVSDIDYFVKSDRSLYVLDKPPISKVEEAIGANIASLVEDGTCLQLGLGAIPNAIMEFLKDKNDLGVHTELVSDGTMELMKAGVITGKKKTLHKNKAIATFASGTAEFYEWLHDNPAVEFYPVDYVNNPYVIARNDNMLSVNSAIHVDLSGQVGAETINSQQFSGIGGQVDFVRGAKLAKGGKSVIALPATAKKGLISRITAGFKSGEAVTTSRSDVDYIVTEYGIAALRGQSIVERARRLIAIAAPEFRDKLKDDFKEVYKLSL